MFESKTARKIARGMRVAWLSIVKWIILDYDVLDFDIRLD